MNEQTSGLTELLRELIRKLGNLKTAMSRLTGKQVQSTSMRQEIRECVQEYFRIVRLPFAGLNLDLVEIDSEMQELMAMADKSSLISSYKTVLASLIRRLSQLAISSERHLSDLAAKGTARNPVTAIEQRI